MKTIVAMGLLFCVSASLYADTAKEKEMMAMIRSMQKELKELKAEVRSLKKRDPAGKKNGLKEEDYANKTGGVVIEMDGSNEGTQQWTKEKIGSIMEQLKVLKEQMLRHNKEIQDAEKEIQ